MKILVAQDNKKQARFLQRALHEAEHVVDLVYDGFEVRDRVLCIEYNLVVLDWNLPGFDGIGICRGLRERGSAVPILMLSARADNADRIAGLDAGADDYLTKPYDLGEFLARVRALIRRTAGTQGHLHIGPLVLDRFERHASVGGQAVDLTPKEFTLLTYLAREAGRTVSRTELLSKVWETTYDTGSNIVDAHVKKLRGKLGAGAKLIETVRGVGYRIESAYAPGPMHDSQF